MTARKIGYKIPVPGYSSNNKPKQSGHDVMTDKARKLIGWVTSIRQAMLNNGIPMPVAEYVAFQALHESGSFTSAVAKQDNNYGGIKWINKPYQDATRGRKAPEGNTYYAHYSGLQQWAKDMARIIRLAPGVPANATTLADYVHRLKMNGYFGASESSYLAALQKWQQLWQGYQKAEYAVKHPKYVQPNAPGDNKGDIKYNFKEWMKNNWGVLAIGIGAIVVIKAISK